MPPVPFPADPKDALLVWAARYLRSRTLTGFHANEFREEVTRLIPNAGIYEAHLPFGPKRAVERANAEARYREEQS